MVDNAEQCALAIKTGTKYLNINYLFVIENWTKMIECIKNYWQQKKLMATGCEPQQIGQLIEYFYQNKLADAQWMAGAGKSYFSGYPDLSGSEP